MRWRTTAESERRHRLRLAAAMAALSSIGARAGAIAISTELRSCSSSLAALSADCAGNVPSCGIRRPDASSWVTCRLLSRSRTRTSSSFASCTACRTGRSILDLAFALARHRPIFPSLPGACGSYFPGALSILKGAVPDRTRGFGHTAPTYVSRFPGSNIPRPGRHLISRAASGAHGSTQTIEAAKAALRLKAHCRARRAFLQADRAPTPPRPRPSTSSSASPLAARRRSSPATGASATRWTASRS